MSAAEYQQILLTFLRDARAARGLSQAQVAAAMDWSPTKVTRIEAGKAGISTVDLRALLVLYGVEDPGRAASLIEVARAARRPGGAVQVTAQARKRAREMAVEYIRRGMECDEMLESADPGLVELLDAALRDIIRQLGGEPV